MVARQRRPVEYWKEVIEDFLKSGMLQKDYAQEHKLSRATLSAWIRRLSIPLSQEGKFSQIDQGRALTFTDVQVLGRIKAATPSLKIEISFPQGHTLKLEMEGTWEETSAFIRALVG